MENTRNFSIISHVNHGKSTLADRFLELTNTIPKEKMREQFLNLMDLEREKGITIKMQPVRMEYQGYVLNLIDTPGHVDFSYEVSKSLAAVEGAVLLVDATKGIQAQTLANLDLAKKQNLVIVPAINKIDMPQARIDETKNDLSQLLNVKPEEIFLISAKLGTNVKELLEAVIQKVPPPKGDIDKPLRALIFSSKYDAFKGIIAYIRLIDGKIKSQDKIYLIQNQTKGEAKEVGFFKPEFRPAPELKAGEIGYVATGIKEAEKIRVGETITFLNSPNIEPLTGYETPKPMVFLSIYPENPDNLDLLKDSLERLKLLDAALSFKPELKEGLGRGFQCGFLGLLHAEIISERLRREFGLELVLSTPSVIYKIVKSDGKEIFIYSASEWPNQSLVRVVQELWAKLRILMPLTYLGEISQLLETIESKSIKTEYLTSGTVELVYEVPLREIINKNFYDRLKSVSKGFASMDYEILDWREGNFVKLDVMILGEKREALSKIVSQNEAYEEGKKMVEKLKENLPPQLFAVPIQAAIGGKIIARETIKARRRDVIAPLYGGDYTRKRKLLERQKKGKKELKEKGEVRIPPQVFLEIYKSG